MGLYDWLFGPGETEKVEDQLTHRTEEEGQTGKAEGNATGREVTSASTPETTDETYRRLCKEVLWQAKNDRAYDSAAAATNRGSGISPYEKMYCGRQHVDNDELNTFDDHYRKISNAHRDSDSVRRGMARGAAKAVASMPGEVVEGVIDAGEAAIGAASDPIGTAKAIGEQATAAYNDPIGYAADTATGTAEGIEDSLFGALKNLPEDATPEQVGEAIGDSLVRTGTAVVPAGAAVRGTGIVGKAARGNNRDRSDGNDKSENESETQEQAEPRERTEGEDGEHVNDNKDDNRDSENCQRCAANPVSIISGLPSSFDHEFTLPGNLPFQIDCQYNADLNLVGLLGRNRLSGMDAFIEYDDEKNQLAYVTAANVRTWFDRPSANIGDWKRNNKARHLGLSQAPDGGLILKDGSLFRAFRVSSSTRWELSEITDRNGNFVRFELDDRQRIAKIVNSEGLAVEITYNAQGFRSTFDLISRQGNKQNILRYEYDDRGNMVLADNQFSRSRTYTYDDKNQRTAWSDGGKTDTKFAFDDAGKVEAVSSESGYNSGRFSYQPEKNLTTFFKGGDETRFEKLWYNDDKQIIAEADAYSNVRYRKYHDQYLVEETDPNGNSLSYEYDGFGNLQSIKDAEDRETFMVWDDDGHMTALVDGLNNSWDYHYDDKGNLTTAIDPLNYFVEFSRNGAGLPVGICRSDGLIQRRVYDAHSQLVALVDYRGQKSTFAYDDFGRLTSTTDPAGVQTQFEYKHQKGKDFYVPEAMVRSDGVRVSHEFHPTGRVASYTDGEGNVSHYRYGAYDVLEEITDPMGGTLRFEYNSETRLTKVINQTGREWTFERDLIGRVVRETDFDGLATSYEYDPAGRVTKKVHADASFIVFSYDKAGLTTKAEAFYADSSVCETIAYTYDDNGRIVEAGNNQTTVKYEYNARGEILAETINDHRIEHEYDCCGNRIARRVGTGSQLYDNELDADGLFETGRRLLRPGVRLTEYVYDPLGALQKWWAEGHDALTFSHDAMGREIARESNSGFRLSQSWDDIGQLVGQKAGRALRSTEAFAAAQLADLPAGGIALERALSWTRTYSPAEVSDSRWGKTSYAYNGNGQVTEAAHSSGTGERFRYDSALNIEASGIDQRADASQSHALDSKQAQDFGQQKDGSPYTMRVTDYRARQPGTDEPTGAFANWSSSPGGRVQRARGRRGERISFTHDALGRVVQRRVERDGFRPREWRFEWDVLDRLVKAITPEGTIWTYGYDAFGRRLYKQRTDEAANRDKSNPAASRIDYVWDGNVIALEIKQTGLLPDMARDEARASGQRVEDKPKSIETIEYHYEPGSFRPLARCRNGETEYFVCDYLGTPKEVFSADGQLKWSANYSLWGQIEGVYQADNDNDDCSGDFQGYDSAGNPVYTTRVGSNGSAALKQVANPDEYHCPIRFQGQWADEETGLYYNRFRYYDPEASQYLSPDPIALWGGVRKHGYVKVPIVHSDPFGLQDPTGVIREAQTIAAQNQGKGGGNVVSVVRDANGVTGVGTSSGTNAENLNEVVDEAYGNNPHKPGGNPNTLKCCAEGAAVTDLIEQGGDPSTATGAAVIQKGRNMGKPIVACPHCTDMYNNLGITDAVK